MKKMARKNPSNLVILVLNREKKQCDHEDIDFIIAVEECKKKLRRVNSVVSQMGRAGW